MPKHVAIIGTDHRYQLGGSARTPEQNDAFAALIRRTCEEHGATCLAEEMSIDALRINGRLASTVEGIALDRGLAHLKCDPSEAQQTAMGLYIERNANYLRQVEGWSSERISEGVSREHRQREEFWLTQLIEADVGPCVFICGSEHSAAFRSLLEDNSFQVTLVADHWEA